MKKSLLHIAAAASFLAALAVTVSCASGVGAGDADSYSQWIKACTGELVTSDATLQVEFTSPVGNTEKGIRLVSDLISFSPSVDGTAKWSADGTTLEFVPAEGALKPGSKYSASVRLDQLTGMRKLPKFKFGFRVAKKAAAVKVANVIVTEAEPESATVYGQVLFSQAPDPEDVTAELFTCDAVGAESQVSVEPSDDPRVFAFSISGIRRESATKAVWIDCKAGGMGFKDVESASALIPGRDLFEVSEAVKVDAGDPYVELHFSEALDSDQNLGGLLGISGVGKAYFQYADNCVRIYYEDTGSRKITVNAYEGIRSCDGRTLSDNFSKTFASDALKPAVEVPLSGTILPDAGSLILPFRAVNLSAVDVSVIKIYESNILSFLQENDLSGSSELRRNGRMIYRKTARLDLDHEKDLHQWQDFSIDLSGLFKEEAGAIYRIRLSFRKEYSLYGKDSDIFSGNSNILVGISSGEMTAEDEAVWDTPYSWYYEDDRDWEEYNWRDRDNPATASYYMNSDRFPNYNLVASNIGLIAKGNDEGKLWIAASDILSASPMGGVEVKAYNYQLQEIGKAKTNAEGFAEIQPKGKAFIIVAKKGDTTSYLKVSEGYGKSLSRFDTGGEVLSKGIKGFVYGERGVWRPGDTIHLVLLAQGRDKDIPDSHPVTMELYTPQGQFFCKQVSADGKDGFWRFDIETSADDPTGTWNAYFKVGGATFHKSVMVETVKPNRLKINFKPESEILEGGKATNFNISSNWLTGPAASGLAAKVEMTLSQTSRSFKGYEDYTFTNPAASFSRSEDVLFEGKLSEDGRLSRSIVLPKAKNAPGMLSANFVCTVLEAGGDASYYSETRLFSPFSSYVGVKLGDSYQETDTDLDYKVVVVSPDGKKISGHKIEYRIWKIDWSWWWESDANSLSSYVNSTGANAVAKGEIDCTGGEASIPFRIDYPEWGRYLIYVKDLESGHASGGVVFIDWPSWRGRSDRRDPDALNMLTFTTDKKEYEVGEEATLYVPAADGGRALVSIENGSRVISRCWVKTNASEDTPFKIPVTAEMSPNFYIHITLVQPHGKVGGGSPVRLYGVQPVLVSNKASRLEPVLGLPEVIRPQEEFSVKVSEKNGKAMTYTIAIVDEGLLDLTSFKTPDPWNAMYKREALGITTWDLYDDIIGACSGKFSPILSIGGDEDLSKGAKKDNRFNPVVEFIGPFTLGKSSNTHKITLPMYVGSVRVMLVAGRDGAYGNAEKAVPVRSPLMILPTLPAAIGCGETVTMPVNVFAMESGVKDVNLSVSIDGPLSAASSSKSVSFSATGDKIVDFTLKGSSEEGTAKVTIKATSGSFSATETVNIEIRNTNAPHISRQNAEIASGKSQSFTWESFDTQGGDYALLELASLPTIDFNGAFEFMRSYPYSCSEQLSSKLLTYLYAKKNLSADNAKAVDTAVPEILQQLYSRQNSDGGFVYWPGAAYSNEWVSSMAGQALVEAQAQGYKVSKGVINSWKNYQKKCVRNWRNSNKYNLNDLQQAYRLYTLALAGEPDAGSMNRLRESANLSTQAAWRLAAAYSLAGKKSVAQEIIGKLGKNVSDCPEDRFSTYWSSLRDKAMILEALALSGSDAEAIGFAREVADEFDATSWNTQETAFATIAMARMAAQFNKGALIAEVKQNTTEQVNSTEALKTVNLDSRRGKVDVTNKSEGTVYATLVTSTRPSFGEAVAADAQGIELKAEYFDLSGKAINPDKLRQGTDFNVRISVSNTTGIENLESLALSLNAASGWEIFNQRLFGTDIAEPCTYKDIRDDKVVWYFDLPVGGKKTFQARCRAAFEGKFVRPAITCEGMYDTRFHANTANGTAEVTK